MIRENLNLPIMPTDLSNKQTTQASALPLPQITTFVIPKLWINAPINPVNLIYMSNFTQSTLQDNQDISTLSLLDTINNLADNNDQDTTTSTSTQDTTNQSATTLLSTSTQVLQLQNTIIAPQIIITEKEAAILKEVLKDNKAESKTTAFQSKSSNQDEPQLSASTISNMTKELNDLSKALIASFRNIGNSDKVNYFNDNDDVDKDRNKKRNRTPKNSLGKTIIKLDSVEVDSYENIDQEFNDLLREFIKTILEDIRQLNIVSNIKSLILKIWVSLKIYMKNKNY